MIKPSDFTKDGKSRFFYNGESISRRQRDKLLGVNEYRKKGESYTPRAKKKGEGYVLPSGDVLSKPALKELQLKRRREQYAEKRAELYHTEEPLSAEQKKELKDRWSDAYDRQSRVSEYRDGIPVIRERISKRKLQRDMLLFIQRTGEGDIDKLRKIYNIKFTDMTAYQDYIDNLCKEMGYNSPDFNKYLGG